MGTCTAPLVRRAAASTGLDGTAATARPAATKAVSVVRMNRSREAEGQRMTKHGTDRPLPEAPGIPLVVKHRDHRGVAPLLGVVERREP